MSADTYTEVTKQSWFSRIGGAFKGIFIGLLLIIASFPLLFWNEGRAVERYKTLQEGAGLVKTVPAEAVDQNNSGELVHLSGVAQTAETLADPVFSVTRNAIKLRRTVEMYQWEEDSDSQTKKKLGGGEETVTTYNYKKEWSDALIDSDGFKVSGHENPSVMPYQTLELVAQQVAVGAFTLSAPLIAKIQAYAPVIPDEKTVPIESSMTKRQPGGFYIGADPAAPQIGDLRVTFAAVDPVMISLVAKQQGSTFEPYEAKAGGKIQLLQVGSHSADEMFATAQRHNKMLTWALRAGGFLLMLIGFNMVFNLFSVLADVIPLLGNIVGAGTGLVAFLLSISLSSVTISIAWIVYRPLLGIIMLAVAAGMIVLIRKKMKSAAPAKPA